MLFTPKHPLEIADQYGDTVYSGFIKIRDEFNDLCLSTTSGVNTIIDGLYDGSLVHVTPSSVIEDGSIKSQHLAQEVIDISHLTSEVQDAIARAKMAASGTDLGILQNSLTQSINSLNSAKVDNISFTETINQLNADLSQTNSDINQKVVDIGNDLQSKIDNINNITIPNVNSVITTLDTEKVDHTEFNDKVNTLTQVDTDNKSLITQNSDSITSIIGKLNSSSGDSGQYTAISQLKQQADSIGSTVTTLQGNVATNTSNITQNANSITNVVATLNKDPGATGQYSAISQLKQTADSISLTVSNKANISDLTVTNNNITTLVANLNKDPGSTGYSAISQLKQQADNISSTVTTLQGNVATNTSNITQNAESITGVVGKLNSSPASTGQYTAISQLKQQADSISSMVTSNTNNLQTQIDSKIEFWFQVSDPSAAWVTTDDKNKHTNDMWFNSTVNELRRWNGSSWDIVRDQKAIDAFNNAATAQTAATNAQNTANIKMRVFTSTPTVPYDVGDLWVGGSSGDLKRCSSSKTSSQSYSASDWVLATKYTDDTALNNFVSTTYSSDKTNLQNQITTNISNITQNANSITSMVATLNSAPNSTNQYSSISQLKQTTDSISATVTSNKTTTDNQYSTLTSNINVQAGRIDTVTASISTTNTNLSSLTQTVNNISSTVSSNKTDADNKFSTQSSQISQNASDISLLVADLPTDMTGYKYKSISSLKIGLDGVTSKVQDVTGTVGSMIQQTANSINTTITGITNNLNDSANCPYSAISMLKDEINLRVKTSDFSGQNLVTQINLAPSGILIAGKHIEVTGETQFNDSVIVERMLSANSVSARTIDASVLNLSSNGKSLIAGSATLDSTGMKITESTGAYTKFDGNGITWYSAAGTAYGQIRRVVQGTATSGQYVRLNWSKTPFVILSPKTCQTMVTGYTNSNIQVVCQPINVTPAGFNIQMETRVLDGTGGQAVPNPSLSGAGSYVVSQDTPNASKDLYATVNCDLGYIEYPPPTPTDPDHLNLISPSSEKILKGSNYVYRYQSYYDSNNYLSGTREYTDKGTNPWKHTINNSTSHTHIIKVIDESTLGYVTWKTLTHAHQTINPPITHNGTAVFHFYYSLKNSGVWQDGGTETLTGYGSQTKTHTVCSNTTPGIYNIKVVLESASLVNSALFYSWSVNGGGVIANTGEVNFMAIESDGNSYYTLE